MRTRLLLAVAMMAASAGPAAASREEDSTTIRMDARAAKLILAVKLTAVRPNAGDPEKGECEFAIEAILRDDASLMDKKTFILRRLDSFDEEDIKDAPRLLFFCSPKKGALDVVKTRHLNGPRVIDYARKALAFVAKDEPAALAFFFRHLEDADSQIAEDAFSELVTEDDAHIVKAAPRFDVVRLRAWLMDPKVPARRVSLYAGLLGTCGKKADAELIQALPRNHESEMALLTAHVLLSPREGFARLLAVLREQNASFDRRFAAIRVIRFLYETRKGIVAEKELVGATVSLLQQDDVADFALEMLRKWKRWEVAGHVFAAARRPSLAANPLWGRVLLRYCIQCKGNAEASNHVAAMRAADAAFVKDQEELLALEAAPKR